MHEFYMFISGAIGILLIGAYIFLNSVLGFRGKTTNRFMRVLILGIFAYFIDGGFGTFLWVLTWIYGIYVVFISIIVFAFGKAGKAAGGLGLNGGDILNVIVGYIAADKIVDFFKRR